MVAGILWKDFFEYISHVFLYENLETALTGKNTHAQGGSNY